MQHSHNVCACWVIFTHCWLNLSPTGWSRRWHHHSGSDQSHLTDWVWCGRHPNLRWGTWINHARKCYHRSESAFWKKVGWLCVTLVYILFSTIPFMIYRSKENVYTLKIEVLEAILSKTGQNRNVFGKISSGINDKMLKTHPLTFSNSTSVTNPVQYLNSTCVQCLWWWWALG